MGLRNRKGFALILVFSMASIVLLLGLSLVSLTQVETASSQYDQGLKVARANARLALQMAIGDLQEFAGPDQRVTATADGLRTDGTGPVETTFNLPATDGVVQPFWTGVWDTDNTTDNPIWLVTRPVDAIYTMADNSDQDADPAEDTVPGYGTSKDLVKLVGVGSAKPEPVGGSQSIHDVWVPKEPLVSDEIVGLASSEQATIGHYAYWVGDEGVKASYLIEDDLPEVLHDEYEIGGTVTLENFRLRQMLAHRYRFEVDGTEVDATDARIESIASDLILRKEVEGTPTGRSYLGMGAGTYSQNDVLRRFHDFTGMSRGLLVDTVRGGLKEDLSNIHEVDVGSSPSDDLVDDLVNNYLMPYLNVSDIPTTSPTALTRAYTIAAKNTTFGGGGPTPTIAPVISEFWLDVRLAAPKLGVGGPPGGALGPPGGGSESQRRRSNIYGQFSVSIELWNPYTSRIDGVDLTIRIENPNTAGLVINYYDDWVGGDSPTSTNAPADFGLEDIMSGVSEFQLNASGTTWKPGEVKAFSGTFEPSGTLELTPGVTFPIDASYYYEIPPPQMPTFESSTEVYSSDRIELIGPSWSPIVALRTSAGDELGQYALSGVSYYEMKSGIQRLSAPTPQFVFSYKWEMRSPDSNWNSYDPRSGQLTEAVLMDSFLDPSPDPPAGYNALTLNHFEYPGALFPHSSSPLIGSSTVLLGFNDDGSIENNIPMFELPRQEYLSLGGLQMAEFPSGLRSHLGASSASISPTASINDVFDRFFLSTVPQSGTTSWTVTDPLPNSRMEPIITPSLTVADLQDPDSGEHLFLNGAFNINSTSVEAWASLLKGVRLGTWAFDDPAGTTPVAGQSELTLTGENQFLRFSQTAEETWRGTYDATDLDASRELIRKGLRSLTDAEIETLSEEIVRAIRTRRQSGSAPVGPFVSLQDFIDSGVIETAIAAAGLNSTVEVGGTSLTYASSFLTQQDILAAIAPYMTARSDTFVIRAYGDAVNPFDDSEVVARAYCEAIVQRVHDKHPSESSSDPLTATDDTAGAFGRNYRVIAFRWMTGDEI